MPVIPNAIRRPLRRVTTSALRKSGYSLVRTRGRWDITEATGMEDEFIDIYKRCAPFTMTSMARMYALYNACCYVVQRDIPGDFVECGVWKGGSSMVAAYTFQSLGASDRRLVLYDTFAGMSKPTDKDISFADTAAVPSWSSNQHGEMNDWMFVSLEEVRQNLLATGFPAEQITFVKGKVEDTIPRTISNAIAILRLDTDWYESTAHNLHHLYPRLVQHGVLILDDYGAWKGARQATDEYFAQQKTRLLLHRIDFTGRIAVKDAG